MVQNKCQNRVLLQALACEPVERHPVWLMRQAGRYLPAYKHLRQRYTLSQMFHEPEIAAKVTLLPIERFPFDALILFSDLLLLAEAFGKCVFYPEQGSPYIEPKVYTLNDLPRPSLTHIASTLSYVLQTIHLVKSTARLPLLGFCPAPWTLLCYLCPHVDHAHPELISWLDRLCEASILYAKLQFQAGVDALQVFDSWTHLLPASHFSSHVLVYWKRFIDALSDKPLLFFSRTNSMHAQEIATIRPSAISFDEQLPLALLRDLVPEDIAIQGNFSPSFLAQKTPQEVFQEASLLSTSMQGKRGIIWNLGHGILPMTPLENVDALLEGLSASPTCCRR